MKHYSAGSMWKTACGLSRNKLAKSKTECTVHDWKDVDCPQCQATVPNPSVWTGQMKGFAPAETDRTSTGTFDQGGPSESDHE